MTKPSDSLTAVKSPPDDDGHQAEGTDSSSQAFAVLQSGLIIKLCMHLTTSRLREGPAPGFGGRGLDQW